MSNQIERLTEKAATLRDLYRSLGDLSDEYLSDDDFTKGIRMGLEFAQDEIGKRIANLEEAIDAGGADGGMMQAYRDRYGI